MCWPCVDSPGSPAQIFDEESESRVYQVSTWFSETRNTMIQWWEALGHSLDFFIWIRVFAGNIRNSQSRICRHLQFKYIYFAIICLQSNYYMICCVVPASRPKLRMKLILTYCHPCLYFRRNLTLLQNLNFFISTSEKIDLSSELIDVVNHVVQYIFSRNIFQFSLRIIVHIEAF